VGYPSSANLKLNWTDVTARRSWNQLNVFDLDFNRSSRPFLDTSNDIIIRDKLLCVCIRRFT
jgi:hypothetical protein